VVGERKEPKPKPKRRRALRGAIEEVENVVATAKEEDQTTRSK